MYLHALVKMLLAGVLVWLIALSATLCSSGSEEREVMAARFGSLEEGDQPLLDIELLKVPLPESTLSSPPQTESVVVVSRHGQRYACQLPHPLPDTRVEQTRPTEINITALLSPLAESNCLIKTVGWWTYEYCHGQFVRQYHMEGGKIMGKSIYLGYYDNETVWDQDHVSHVKGVLDSMRDNLAYGSYATPFHRVNFTNGTLCDHTGQPRQTTVKLSCNLNSGEILYDVVERETCTYSLTVHTELLCQHPLFRAGQDGEGEVISCSPLVSDETYDSYKQQLESQDEGGYCENKNEPEDSGLPGDVLSKPLEEMTAEEKQLMLEQVQRNIDSLYQRFQQELSQHNDPLVEQLRQAAQNDYQEFEELKSSEKPRAKRESKEPYQVQGMEEAGGRGSGGRGELLERETVEVERLTEVEEAINTQLQEHMRQSGIVGKPEVKVLALPANMADMLLDQEEEGDSDGEEEAVRMVLKLGGGSQADMASQLFNSLFDSGGESPDHKLHPDEARARELEDNYNQLWTADNNNKRKQNT